MSAVLKPRPVLGALLGFAAAVLLPVALAAGYFYGIAADRYVTEIRYSVRSGAAMQRGEDSVGGALGSGAALVFASDSFVLANYLRSREALLNVESVLPIREMLARDGGDPLRRFDINAPVEEVLPFWRAAVAPRFDALTGITTVEVTLFTAEDAEAVGVALVRELRRIVDSLSAEARAEMLAYVNSEFSAAARNLDSARDAIEAFRRANRVITPTEQVAIGAEIISALSSRLAERLIEMRSLRQQTPNSPRISAIQRDIRSIEEQLRIEIARRGGEENDGADALPGQLASFEELESRYQIARDMYISTLQLRQSAEANAALGRAELVVFVPPRGAVTATQPDRAMEVLQVFVAALLLWVIVRILLASFRTQ